VLDDNEYIQRDALGLAELVKNGDVTPLELLETAIARADSIDPAINAISTPMYDQAAAQIKSGLSTGIFAGVPFLLKDLRASYKGARITAGSAWFSSISDFDSIVTTRFKDAGLVIMGKTNVPELGLSIDTQNSLFGATHNPWGLDHSAGGSSGGSAAAVAARIVPAAHASDGGGSTRVPSANCGTFGLKTSRGRATYGPDTGDELIGMSTQHATTLSVRDSAALLDIDGAPDYGDPYWAPPVAPSYLALLDKEPPRLRIALTMRAPNGTPVHPDCIAAAEKAAKLCEALGHQVEEADHGIDWNDGFGDAVNIIFGVGMLANARLRSARTGSPIRDADFAAPNRKFFEIGASASAVDYAIATKKLHTTSRIMAEFHTRFDILLSPSMTMPPQLLSDFDYTGGDGAAFIEQFWNLAAFMPLANASGQPAMTVPLHWNAQDLPVGAQFMARFGGEDILLQLAAQLEKAAPWFNRRPALAEQKG
jgi:Asp-tRNA(Asn)/Glu-tRNA(Gln) amidotransferase A subunit family amidase